MNQQEEEEEKKERERQVRRGGVPFASSHATTLSLSSCLTITEILYITKDQQTTPTRAKKEDNKQRGEGGVG